MKKNETARYLTGQIMIRFADLETGILNNFNGEALEDTLKEIAENHEYFSKNVCDGILHNHGKEIEELVPREEAISAIQDSGTYDREYLKIYQVHEAVAARLDMVRNDFEEMLSAHPHIVIKEIVGPAVPEYLQDFSNVRGRSNFKDYIEGTLLGRDIYRLAKIQGHPISPATAAPMYKHYASEIDSIIEKLPAGRRNAWKDTPEDKVNLAIISTVEGLYKKNKEAILKNPGKTLFELRQEKKPARAR